MSIPTFRFAHPEQKQSVWLFLHLRKTSPGNRKNDGRLQMAAKETGWNSVDWINLTQDWDK